MAVRLAVNNRTSEAGLTDFDRPHRQRERERERAKTYVCNLYIGVVFCVPAGFNTMQYWRPVNN